MPSSGSVHRPGLLKLSGLFSEHNLVFLYLVEVSLVRYFEDARNLIPQILIFQISCLLSIPICN